MRVKSICIVGGGSSGWMSAALLSKNLPETKIILIESNTIKPIGVGEVGEWKDKLRKSKPGWNDVLKKAQKSPGSRVKPL